MDKEFNLNLILELSSEELKDELLSRGISVTGNIAELRIRLAQATLESFDPVDNTSLENSDELADADQPIDLSLRLSEKPSTLEPVVSQRINRDANLEQLDAIPKQVKQRFDLSKPLDGPRGTGLQDQWLPDQRDNLLVPPQGQQSRDLRDDPSGLFEGPNERADLEAIPRGENRNPRGCLDDDVDYCHLKDALDFFKKHKIEFSGRQTDDHNEFLEKLSEAYGVLKLNDQKFLECIPFVLNGVALHWFRSNKNQWATFEQFDDAWRERFGDPDYQFNLFEEIRHRTQHPEERVADYLTAMKCLFNKVVPVWTETTQIKMAVKNILPRLRFRLSETTIGTWSELERVAVKHEMIYLNSKKYKLPPKPEDAMFPSLAYHENPSRLSFNKTMANLVIEKPDSDLEDDLLDLEDDLLDQVDYYEELPPLKNKTVICSENIKTTDPNVSVTLVNGILCFNCGKRGHFLSKCREPRRVFCKICGKRGVYKSSCPNCSPDKQYCALCGLVGYSIINCPECKRFIKL